jgi:uncharacterized protein HemX
MPDKEKVKETEKSHLLVDLVKAATERKGSSSGGSPPSGSSLVVYLILTAIAVIGFSVLGWLLVRARREAAKLAYELRKKEEEQKRVAEDHKLAKTAEERKKAHSRVHALEAQIKVLREKLEAQKAAHAERTKSLEAVTSWEELGL